MLKKVFNSALTLTLGHAITLEDQVTSLVQAEISESVPEPENLDLAQSSQ